MNTDQIALQLYTVRERTATDMLGTLRELATIGYRAVEFAGYGGVPVAELKAVLDELGMRAMGAHVPYDRFAGEPDQVFAELRELGVGFAIVPWLAPERRVADQMRPLAATFNQWGERCRAEGLRFAYHNHDFEFVPLPTEGGQTAFDILLAETDPALVGFELDAYWVRYAGGDPVDLLRRQAGRFPLLHVKDMAAGEARADAPFGTGTIAWAPLLEAAAASGVEWYIVEQDHPQDALADVRTSLRNLEAMAAAPA